MAGNAVLDVMHPSGEQTRIVLDPLPFRIGRGPENHLILRDNRASRTHAWIVLDHSGAYSIEDLESTHGTWIDGERIRKATRLNNGSTVHFGFEDSYRLVFSRTPAGLDRSIKELVDSPSTTGTASRLARLRSVIAAARSLQTSPAIDDVLSAIVDAALALTGAERGFILLRSGDSLELRGGQDNHGASLSASDLNVPPAVLLRALNERRELLLMTLSIPNRDDSVGLRNITCVPLVHFRSLNTQQTLALSSQNDTVGVLYLDTTEQQTPLSDFNRELLYTLALEASTVLENAQLLNEERQKLLLERELAVAREIQQSLLPAKLPSDGWFQAAGSNIASAQVSGDYFDVRAVSANTWAAVIADVSGKGVSSALLASLLQGAFLLASELDVSLDILMAKINVFLTERTQGERYATLFYATIQRSGEMTWANAGHCAPLLLRRTGQVEELTPTGRPLGLLANAAFQVRRTQLFHGDIVIAFSDGLTEAENERGQTFNGDLHPALTMLPGKTAQEIHERLVASVLTFIPGSTPKDDITVLVIAFQGDDDESH